MENGDGGFPNQDMFSSANVCGTPEGVSIDNFFDEFLKDSHACTHTHTCNPPGPDFSHTHTCFHVHTKIVPASGEGKNSNDEAAESTETKSKKRPSGNREAVRKYREKKKARAASLEDEVVKLRALNQQLLKRLQGETVLEAEIARLKCLLVDIRGRIEGEIGSFPYQKSPQNYVVNPCNIQCNDQVNCLHSVGVGKRVDNADLEGYSCEFGSLSCLACQSLTTKDVPDCELGNFEADGNSSLPSNNNG